MLDKVSNLKPLSKNKSFINQNGTYTATGTIDNKKVKIYSPKDKKAIKLRLFLENSICGKYFPKIIYYDDEYIADEWIDEPTLIECNKEYKSDELILEFIHNLSKIEYDIKIFDYFYHIFERIDKLDHPLRKELQGLKIINKINHNDLHPDNILLSSNKIIVVDNEFLGNNDGWIMNLKNSFLKNNQSFYSKFIDTNTLEKLWEIRTSWKK